MKPLSNKKFLILIALLILATSCAQKRARYQPIHYRAVGVASWYGPGFHGKKTANGERFDSKALTAAHKTLPFDTRVKVTNLSNDKSVVVRINDRGPYAGKRLIDLSKSAARKIDMLGTGTAKVEVLALSTSDDKKSSESDIKVGEAVQADSKEQAIGKPKSKNSEQTLTKEEEASEERLELGEKVEEMDSPKLKPQPEIEPEPDSSTSLEGLIEQEDETKEDAQVPGVMEEF